MRDHRLALQTLCRVLLWLRYEDEPRTRASARAVVEHAIGRVVRDGLESRDWSFCRQLGMSWAHQRARRADDRIDAEQDGSPCWMR